MFGKRNNSGEQEKVKFSKDSFKESFKIFAYVKPYTGYFIASMFLLLVSTLTFMTTFLMLKIKLMISMAILIQVPTGK